jgi:hypothetical protein
MGRERGPAAARSPDSDVTARPNSTVRTAGLATGLALAALLVFAFRVPASEQSLGAGIRVQVSLPGELDAERRHLLATRDLLPVRAAAARGSLELRSITSVPVRVSARLSGGERDLDHLLRIELTAGGKRLAAGSLAELRKPSRPVRLPAGATARLRMRAWLPADVEDFDGRQARATLVLKAELPEAGRR